MIRGLHHISRTVADMGRSLGFYRGLLNLSLVLDEEVEGAALDRVIGLTGARLRLVALNLGGGQLLELLEYRSPRGRTLAEDLRPADVGAYHLALLVDDVTELHDRLVREGVQFTCPPTKIEAGMFAGTLTTYCLDPDGLLVELWEPPSRSQVPPK